MLTGVDASQVGKTTCTHAFMSQVWAHTHMYIHMYAPVHAHPTETLTCLPTAPGYTHPFPPHCLLAYQSKREWAAELEHLIQHQGK